MKINLRKPKGIPLEQFLMFVTMFCVVTFALLEHASVSIPIVSMIKTPIMYLGALCILFRFFFFVKRLRKKKYFFLFLAVLAMCLMLFASAAANSDPRYGDPPLKDTIRLVLYLLELFLLMIWVAEQGRSKQFLDFVFYYLLILTFLTDFLLFTGILRFSDGRFETFLVGTKFSVSYFHMNLLTMWYVRNRTRFHSDRKAKRVIWIGLPIVLLVALRVDCISGILGCVMLLVLFLLLDTPVQRRLLKLNSPVLLLLFLTASVVFPFVAEQLLSLPAVEYVVENILGRDNRLTGRLNIFEFYAREMRGYWQWGYGYGNGNVASTSLFGYANAQNALLHWVLQTGIPAVVCLVWLMLMIFRQLSKASNKMQSMPFAVLIYMYIVLGMVETTFSMSFLMWFAVIFMQVNEKKQQPKRLPEKVQETL